MTLQEIAQTFADAFEQRERDNGDKFYTLREGSPEWMTDTCMVAHNDGAMLPDDWRYRMIAHVARELADREPENWDDESPEAIDGLVSIYNHELLDWLASHGSRVDYADSAAEEGLVSASAGILQRARAGQYQEYCEVWAAIVEALRERAEEEEE
jgi:hypothetical protein